MFLHTRQVREGQEAYKCFYIREGEVFGAMYGYKFLRSLDEMATQLTAHLTMVYR